MASDRTRRRARLAVPLPDEERLRSLGRLAARCGTRAWLVGGPVRDILLGRPSPDIDLAVDSRPRRFGEAAARATGGRFVFHRRFLTGTVGLPDGSHIDLGRTRSETYPAPAALPRVRPAPVERDLARRDFTVNAMALDLSPRSFARLLDPLSGRADLAARTIRVIHDRSFIDDPTRIFRAIRFAVRLGFEIEPATLALMRASVRAGLPARLSPERVLYELRLVCAEPAVLPMIEAVLHERLLGACFGRKPAPGLLDGLHRLSRRGATPGILFVYLLSRLPVTERFPVTRDERDSARLVRSFGPVRRRLAQARRASTVYRTLAPLPETGVRVMALLERGAAARALRRYLGRLAHVRIDTTGRDLRALGLEPGPRYRRILDRLLDARLDGRVRSRSGELALTRRLVARRGK